MKIIYVIDTNLFIHQPNFRNALSLSTIAIPRMTSQELNGLKKSQDIEASVMARLGIKWMDALGSQGDLARGVSLPNGAVVQTVAKAVSGSYSNEAGDDEILRTAIFLKEEHPDQKVILLTNDHGFLVLARQHVYAQHYSDNRPHFSYYDRLGVYERATAEEITQSYRSLCKEYHPDHHQQSPLYNAVMAEINEAYDVLSVPAKKQRYDSYELPMWHRQFHSTSQGRARTGTGYTYQSAGRTYGKVWTAEDIWKEATKQETHGKPASPFSNALSTAYSYFLTFLIAAIILGIIGAFIGGIATSILPSRTNPKIPLYTVKRNLHKIPVAKSVKNPDLKRERIEAEIRRLHNTWDYYNDTGDFIGPNLGKSFDYHLTAATDYIRLDKPEQAFRELKVPAARIFGTIKTIKILNKYKPADFVQDKRKFMAVFTLACQKYMASHSRQDLMRYFSSQRNMRKFSELLTTLPLQKTGQAIVNTSAEDWPANRGNENSITAADQLKRY